MSALDGSGFQFIDMDDPRHVAVTGLIEAAYSIKVVVHGTRMHDYPSVSAACGSAVKALLADPATVVPLLDEWVRGQLLDSRGVTVAEPQDFPPYLHHKLDGAWMYRYYRVPGSINLSVPMLAIAFRPDGLILTANELYAEDCLNRFDGVRDTP